MTTVTQLSAMLVGAKTGGFDLTIKTVKKKWQVKSKWVQQCVLTDHTGDILADVNIGGCTPLQRGALMRIVVCEIQPSFPDKKLYVDQFRFEEIGEPEDPWQAGDSDKVVRSKVKCLLTAGFVKGVATRVLDVEDITRYSEKFVTDPRLVKIIDSVVKG